MILGAAAPWCTFQLELIAALELGWPVRLLLAAERGNHDGEDISWGINEVDSICAVEGYGHEVHCWQSFRAVIEEHLIDVDHVLT